MPNLLRWQGLEVYEYICALAALHLRQTRRLQDLGGIQRTCPVFRGTTGHREDFFGDVHRQDSGKKIHLIVTGSLGDVMKESVQAALSYIRSHTHLFGINEDFFEKHDIHIPAGAIAKDGPSARLTITVVLISLVTGRPCRRDVALSGELTLSGRILPIGGIKEKVLAAHRAGVKAVVFPRKNEAELKGLPPDVEREVQILLIDELGEVTDQVLR